MLVELQIKNIALVDRTRLRLNSGLTVLTGETGAGKSVVVTSLALTLGARADREQIRHGCDSATVRARFDVTSNRASAANSTKGTQSPLKGTLSPLSVERTIARKGGSRCKIDGRAASLVDLKATTSSLAEIVSQHAGQELMDEANHLTFLDRFAGLLPDSKRLADIYEQWQQSVSLLRRTLARRDELKREHELLQFQRREIEQAQITPGEEEEFVAERKRLDSVRSLLTSTETISHILVGEDNSVIALLAAVRKELDRMAAVDPKLEPTASTVSEMDFSLEDVRRTIEQYGSSLVDDPTRIEEINQRLDEIYRLKKKYGGSEEAILSTLSEIKRRLSDQPEVDLLISELEAQAEAASVDYTKLALSLSKARTSAAKKLRKAVIEELASLAIEQCDFAVDLLYEEAADGVLLNNQAVQPFPHGLENARFMFSANPGEPMKSLVKTASGGEVSRVLLALKSAEMNRSRRPQRLLVFDEVDAGIGGRTAIEVANKLKKLSQAGQILVVTHLHQIARVADNHLVAEKSVDDAGRTVITIRQLGPTDLSSELDRMVALPDGGAA